MKFWGHFSWLECIVLQARAFLSLKLLPICKHSSKLYIQCDDLFQGCCSLVEKPLGVNSRTWLYLLIQDEKIRNGYDSWCCWNILYTKYLFANSLHGKEPSRIVIVISRNNMIFHVLVSSNKGKCWLECLLMIRVDLCRNLIYCTRWEITEETITEFPLLKRADLVL